MTSTHPHQVEFNTPLPEQHEEYHPAQFAEGWAASQPDQALFELASIDRHSLEFKLS